MVSPVGMNPFIEVLRAWPKPVESAYDGSFCKFLKVLCEARVGDFNRGNLLQFFNQKRLGFGGLRGFGILRVYCIFVGEGRSSRRLSCSATS